MPHPESDPWRQLPLNADHLRKNIFDPKTGTEEAIATRNLPPRPDANIERVLFKHWLDLVEGDVETPVAGLEKNLPLNAPAPNHDGARRTPRQHSLNWAGAVVPAQAGRRYTRIAGSWTVPDVVGGPGGSRMSLVSAWIGLGGATRASRSLPQIGSEHGWLKPGDTGPTHRLWCQWWLGDDPAGYLSWNLTKLNPEPGDRILCSLVVTDPMRVLCHFRLIPVAQGKAPKLVAIEGIGMRPVAASSAEWIVERPREVHAIPAGPRQMKQRRQLAAGKLMALPKIKAHVTGAATAEPAPFRIEQAAARLGKADDVTRSEITPRRGALIAMIETRQAPSRLARVIRPRLRRLSGKPGEDLEFRIR